LYDNRTELIARFRKLRGELARAVDTIPYLYSKAAAREMRWQAEMAEQETRRADS
jgi:hypothetical protein